MACPWHDFCPLRKFEKEGKITSQWRKKYCGTKNNWKKCKRYQMEENGEPHSVYMMPDGTIIKK
jgi:hypothetical protein